MITVISTAWGAITNFFSNIQNGLSMIKQFFSNLIELIVITLDFIPQPFLAITLTFMPIIFGSIIYKVVRG